MDNGDNLAWVRVCQGVVVVGHLQDIVPDGGTSTAIMYGTAYVVAHYCVEADILASCPSGVMGSGPPNWGQELCWARTLVNRKLVVCCRQQRQIVLGTSEANQPHLLHCSFSRTSLSYLTRGERNARAEARDMEGVVGSGHQHRRRAFALSDCWWLLYLHAGGRSWDR